MRLGLLVWYLSNRDDNISIFHALSSWLMRTFWEKESLNVGSYQPSSICTIVKSTND